MNPWLLWAIMSGLFAAFGGSFWLLGLAIEQATSDYLNRPEDDQ